MDKTVLLVSLGERFDAARAADMAQRLTEGLDGVRLRAFAAVEEEDTYAVSYTHLDVYKRQARS